MYGRRLYYVLYTQKANTRYVIKFVTSDGVFVVVTVVLIPPYIHILILKNVQKNEKKTSKEREKANK